MSVRSTKQPEAGETDRSILPSHSFLALSCSHSFLHCPFFLVSDLLVVAFLPQLRGAETLHSPGENSQTKRPRRNQSSLKGGRRLQPPLATDHTSGGRGEVRSRCCKNGALEVGHAATAAPAPTVPPPQPPVFRETGTQLFKHTRDQILKSLGNVSHV